MMDKAVRKSSKRKPASDFKSSDTEGRDSKYFKQQPTYAVPSPTLYDIVGQDDTTAIQSCKLNRHFYNVACVDLARSLLGKRVVRIIGGLRVSGRIVETECYLGGEDKASHSYNGKRTERNEAMFLEPGTAYVYNIYGMYCCLNISSQGEGAAVLLRALEPIEGKEEMLKTRGQKSSKALKDKDLTNGPSKLCQALQVTKNAFNKLDLVSSNTLWIEKDVEIDDKNVVSSPRINIGYAEEWTDKPLRFYILGNPFVSVRNKAREALHQEDLSRAPS